MKSKNIFRIRNNFLPKFLKLLKFAFSIYSADITTVILFAHGTRTCSTIATAAAGGCLAT